MTDKWIKCSEELPERLLEVLLSVKCLMKMPFGYPQKNVFIGYLANNDCWYRGPFEKQMIIAPYLVTHWQPIPAPSENKDEGNE